MKLPYIFERRSDTYMVIEGLIPEVQKTIKKYGVVTVADVYEIMDKLLVVFEETKPQFIDFKRGWTDASEFLANSYGERRWGWTEHGIEVSTPKYLQ